LKLLFEKLFVLTQKHKSSEGFYFRLNVFVRIIFHVDVVTALAGMRIRSVLRNENTKMKQSEC